MDYSVVYSVLYNFRRKPRYIQHNPRRRHRHSICARARVGQIYRRNVGRGGSQGSAHRARTLPAELASAITTVVLCATLIYELVGPIVTKLALSAAGEIEKKPKKQKPAGNTPANQ